MIHFNGIQSKCDHLKPLVISFFLLLPVYAFSQVDSLVLTNGDIMVGEIKSMDKGVLYIETSYSENDFNVKWSEVKKITTTTRYLVTLADGQRLNGNLKTSDSGEITIQDENGAEVSSPLADVVYLKQVKSEFWSRVNAYVDVGYNFAKANHLKQFTTSFGAGYVGDKWGLELFYADYRSYQDSLDATKRNEGGINYKFYLPRDWYLMADFNYLSNTEQALTARFTEKLGAGKFLIHTNQSYWGLGGGVSFNSENFSNETSSRSSAEAYLGSELNLFDTGDLSLYSTLYIYPSLTESERLRSDFKVDTKYEFANDIYIKLNFSINYDNKPAIEGKETDYVYGISFGWEL